MKIREIMTRSVRTVRPDASVRLAAELMRQTHAGSIPVCDGERLVGMLTDRDIALRSVAKGLSPDTPVRVLMSRMVVCAHENDEVEEVAQRMSDEQIRRMPVLDGEDRLAGIVSLGDLSRETPGHEAAHYALDGVSAPGGSHEQ